MKHRGEFPGHGPSRQYSFRSSQPSCLRPINSTTRSECYYCNRFGKRARKCGHNDTFPLKKLSTDNFATGFNANPNVTGRSATSSTPSAPLYPTSSSPPPPYQGPPAYVPPPPTYEETRLPPVIVTQPPTTVFKWNPVGIVCPYCHSSVVTKVRSEAGLLAWLLCGVLCLMGLWAFCCLIPFYLESTQDVIHTCPLCKSQVGKNTAVISNNHWSLPRTSLISKTASSHRSMLAEHDFKLPTAAAAAAAAASYPLIITTQPEIRQPFRNLPVHLKCPSCRKEISTTLEYHNGLLTYLACVGIFFVGGSCGCCLIPFCVNACKDVDHKCPSCKTYVGSYRILRD
ncbi:unnamed protein product [Heterobilharzia americana]|nr:unnamed protein product [Heterobilharzia americana]